MRQIVIAPSFDREAEDIGVYIEGRFGESARRDFVDALRATCIRIATVPRIGTFEHGYDTLSAGFALEHNWIFFDHDDEVVNFVHIVSTNRDKPSVAF
jgi:plasmid stabilization system protein ParE